MRLAAGPEGEAVCPGKRQSISSTMLVLNKERNLAVLQLGYAAHFNQATLSTIQREDRSLTARIGALVRGNETPLHYFVTADSAVPVADSVRGY